MAIIIAAFTFFAVACALWALLTTLHRSQNTVLYKLQDYSTEQTGKALASTKHKRATEALRSAFGKIAPKHLSARYATILSQGGIMLKGEEFVVAIGISALFGTLLGWVLMSFLGAALLGFFGFRVPDILLKNYLRKRLISAEGQLVDLLTVCANAMRAGSSFLQALELAGREMAEPIGAELKRTLREISLGLSMDEALQRLSTRLPSADLDLVVTAVIIQRQVGGDLAGILDSIALTIRNRQQLKVKVRTLTAQGRLSGMVIGLLPLVILLALQLMNPDYVSVLWTEPLGIAMLLGGAISQIIGMILIGKIIRVDV